MGYNKARSSKLDYNAFDEFMANLASTLGEDHPLYKKYKEAHNINIIQRNNNDCT